MNNNTILLGVHPECTNLNTAVSATNLASKARATVKVMRVVEDNAGNMSPKQRSLLVNLNRLFIFLLSLAGLLMDGYHGADLPCGIALVVWLWLPFCARMEAKVLNRVSAKGRHLVGGARGEFLSPDKWVSGTIGDETSTTLISKLRHNR